jgi:hypothetical protein
MISTFLDDIRHLLNILLKDWVKLFLCTMGGIILSLSVAYILPPEYEAWTLINSGTVGVTGTSVPIEDVTSMILRLRAPITLENILRASGKPVSKANLKKLLLSTRLSAYGNSLQVRVSANSYNEAISIVKLYFDELKIQQAPIINNCVENSKELMSITIQQKKQLIDLLKISPNKHADNDNFYARELILNTIIHKDTEIQKFRQNLSPPLTEEARIIISVTCLPWPIFPNRLHFAALGAFLGLSIGLSWVFSINMGKK